MQRAVFFLLATLLYFSVSGQQYEQSGGIRLGRTSGLTFKKFITGEEAVEFMASGRKDGLQITTMYVFHEPMQFSFNENFYAYYGLGGHIGFEKYNDLSKELISIDPPEFIFEEKPYYVMGVDALLGIEYRWLSVPITIGFDIKPYFNFIGMRHTQATFWDAAISFKYIF